MNTHLQQYGIDENELKSMLKKNDKIGAVRLLYENTDWGLKKSKEFIDNFDENTVYKGENSYENENSVITDFISAEILNTVKQLIQDGKTLEAVALINQNSTIGLFNSKKMVETIQKNELRFTVSKKSQADANRLKIETKKENGIIIVTIQKGNDAKRIIDPDDADWDLVKKSMIYTAELREYEEKFFHNTTTKHNSTLFLEERSVFTARNIILAAAVLLIIISLFYFKIIS